MGKRQIGFTAEFPKPEEENEPKDLGEQKEENLHRIRPLNEDFTEEELKRIREGSEEREQEEDAGTRIRKFWSVVSRLPDEERAWVESIVPQKGFFSRATEEDIERGFRDLENQLKTTPLPYSSQEVLEACQEVIDSYKLEAKKI